MTDLAKQLEEAAREKAELQRQVNDLRYSYARVKQELDQARARLVPEGWVCVPREPTEKMLNAAFSGNFTDYEHDALGYFEDIWKAMIAAVQPDADPRKSG